MEYKMFASKNLMEKIDEIVSAEIKVNNRDASYYHYMESKNKVVTGVTKSLADLIRERSMGAIPVPTVRSSRPTHNSNEDEWMGDQEDDDEGSEGEKFIFQVIPMMNGALKEMFEVFTEVSTNPTRKVDTIGELINSINFGNIQNNDVVSELHSIVDREYDTLIDEKSIKSVCKIVNKAIKGDDNFMFNLKQSLGYSDL